MGNTEINFCVCRAGKSTTKQSQQLRCRLRRGRELNVYRVNGIHKWGKYARYRAPRRDTTASDARKLLIYLVLIDDKDLIDSRERENSRAIADYYPPLLNDSCNRIDSQT